MNQLVREVVLGSGKSIQIISGDITEEHVDAIVNAANAYLQHGGGVAGAISLNGGPQIQVESDAWVEQHGPIQYDSPAFTGGGELPCRYLIHAVGPVWGEGDEDVKLAAAIMGALILANRLELNSIAFPAISTGIFGFPKERAAKIILQVFKDYFGEFPDTRLELVRLALFDEESVAVFLQAADLEFNIPNNNQMIKSTG